MIEPTHTLRRHPYGPLATRIAEAALEAVRPETLAQAWAAAHVPTAGRVWILGAGKASEAMARGVLAALGDRVAGGLLVCKHAEDSALGPLELRCGAHPVPNETSTAAGAAMLAQAAEVRDGDVVVGLLSGGASSLMVAPASDHDLEGIVALTEAALRDAVPIESLNARRAETDQLKGGGLARAITPHASIAAAVLCDVLGGTAHDVGSGPLDDPRVDADVLADNDTAVQAAARAARAEGLEVQVEAPLRGEARVEGARWARARMDAPPTDAVRCTIAGGETVVTVRGDGLGGRNQEFALAAAPQLLHAPHALLLSLATDGEDGPTDAAGAVVDGATVIRALEAGLDPDAYLKANNAYAFFDALDDLLRTGPTGTNVCDLKIAFS
ncbi:MAG: MOFRL family protein [Myxococcota bacterium]